MYSIILCGGSGTRLWPLSRKNFPKQFLTLYSDKSLIQETYLRMRSIMPKENIFFLTNEDNFFNVFNQIKEIEKDFNKEQILSEPVALNTAPAITLAIKHLAEKIKVNLDTPIAVLPSDHYIGASDKYLELIKKLLKEVDGNIGTLGITPTRPETGYGYIKKGEKIGGLNRVKEFKEKPPKEIAEKYFTSGEYVWNSGIYIFNIRSFVRELKKYAPEMYGLLIKSQEEFKENYKNLPSISIDYAISEKSDQVVVLEGEFGWSDIGSFDSLIDIADSKENDRHIRIDSENIFVHSSSNRLVATLGVSDLNIIETADSILIQKKGRGEDVKRVVDHLKERKKKEIEHNLIVHRPWGKYEVLIDDQTHKVKRITVYPGEILSLQSHYHRVEHWVVVKGVAKVVLGEEETFLRENESTFIPTMTKHRLENPGKIALEIIEVQTGSYLEEDDIIRYDDVYNRVEK